MALTNNGVQVSINSGQVPALYTLPTVTTFTNQEYITVDMTYTIAKSTYENANGVTGFTALVAAINAAAAASINQDFDTTGRDYTIYTDWLTLTHNCTLGNALYKDTAISVTAGVKIYIKNT